MRIQPLILAAGKGTRMRSSKPKVLQAVGGKSMLEHVLTNCSTTAGAGNKVDKALVVVGFGAGQIKTQFGDLVNYVDQAEQLGTGHAVLVASDSLADDAIVLILYGDVPFVSSGTLSRVAKNASTGALSLLTVRLDDSSGYGRIIRDDHGAVRGIVEQKDADPDQLEIDEVNTGIMAVQGRQLKAWVQQLSNDNAQNEYYLTDIVSMAVEQSVEIAVTHPETVFEVLGANDRVQLSELERQFRKQQAGKLMGEGATLIDADRVDVRGQVRVGKDVCIDANVVFEGDVELGDNAWIESNVVIKNSVIGADCRIRSFSHIEGAHIASAAVIGPYARLREGSVIGANAKIGNFVETKNIQLGEGSKASHLSYLGDSKIGSNVNIGAGTITCNYDGKNKHKTQIEDGVFVGSNSALIAPVTIGKGATVAAGSVVTNDVTTGELCIARPPQRAIKNWVRPDQETD